MSDKTNESETEETQSKREKLVDLIKKIALKNSITFFTKHSLYKTSW